jgi:hypothetical protein
MLQDTMDQASGLLEIPSMHIVICTVMRYVPLSKMCEQCSACSDSNYVH